MLSILLTSLITSPLIHANTVTTLWNKPEHRVWVISGAAFCAVLLALITWYRFSTQQKGTPPSSTHIQLASDVPPSAPVKDLNMKIENGDFLKSCDLLHEKEDQNMARELKRRLQEIDDESESDGEDDKRLKELIRERRDYKKMSKKNEKGVKKEVAKARGEFEDSMEELSAVDDTQAVSRHHKTPECFEFSDSHIELSKQRKLAQTR